MPLKAQGEFTLIWENIGKLDGALSIWLGGNSGPTKSTPSVSPYFSLLTQLADTAAELRDLARLKEYAPRAEERASHYGHSLFLGVARRARGIEQLLTGDHARAQDSLHQALALFQKYHARWQIGRTLLALGELALAQSNPLEARACYSEALAQFNSLGAVRYIEQAQNALERLN